MKKKLMNPSPVPYNTKGEGRSGNANRVKVRKQECLATKVLLSDARHGVGIHK